MPCEAQGVAGISALQLIRVEESDGDLQLLRPRRRVLPLGAMVFRQVGLQPQWSSILRMRMCVVRSSGRDDYTHAFRVSRPSHLGCTLPLYIPLYRPHASRRRFK